MSFYTKRLEVGKFIWPSSGTGETVQISAAQLGYLDLSRFDAAPLIAFTATKETNYEHGKNG